MMPLTMAEAGKAVSIIQIGEACGEWLVKTISLSRYMKEG